MRNWFVNLLALATILIALPACQRIGGGPRPSAGTVHVLFSALNSEHYGNAGSERIEQQLQTAGFNVRRIGDAELAALNGVTPEDVVVMCGIYLMNEEPIAALTKFARSGGGIMWIDAPIESIPTSAALRELLGCSAFTVSWDANYTDPGSPRPILYTHYINGGHNFFLSYRCYGNSTWAVSSAYEFGRFPPITNSEWDVIDRSPVRGTGIIDRVPVWTLNMPGKGRVVLFNYKAQICGGYESMDMIRRAAAWLLADGDEAKADAILAGRTGAPKPISPRLNRIEAVGQVAEEPSVNPRESRMPMGIFVRPQNYGQSRDGRMPPGHVREWPLFRKLVENMRTIGANSTVVSAGMSSFSGPRNMLAEFIDAMHEQGFRVITYSGDPGPAGPRATLAADAGVVGRARGGEPERAIVPVGRDVNSRERATTQTQARAERARAQLVSNIWEFTPKWTEFIERLAEHDLDGMCVPPDEYRRPVYNGDPAADNEATRRFRQAYGYEMPAELGDNPESRAWLNYQYDAQATAYATWNNAVMKKKPGIMRTLILFMGELQYNKMNPTNWGKIGHACDWDLFMSDPYMDTHMDLTNHWYVPETVKRLTAASKNRRAMVTLENNRLREYNEQIRPIHVYGQTVSSIANGSRGVLFFHYFKIFDENGEPYYGRYERTIQANSLLRTLERWGALDGQVPKQVALMFGHMGQDYVGLKNNSVNLGNGYDAQQAAIEMLLANGYPFEIYETDHEADWEKLPAETRVLIVPFAYAVSDKAVAQLEAHARAGKKIVIMQRLGEADMKGDPRPTPALAELVAKYPGTVVKIDGDVPVGRLTPDYEARYCKAIDEALGGEKPVLLKRAGQDIEATVLDLPGGKKILFALNWERRPASFGLGVNLPKGRYRLTERNLKGTQPAAIGGKEVLSARDLRKFAVDLEAEELKFWLIEPAA